ncbi:arylsulfatase [Sedimentisphaera salicampi]|uniref:Arylsulfatase n=1 Tax=Sedimentisphaera salicampi TaxID=1941349 RepID=A0A1W6LKT3_9BACT|nr:arylsulfatase [Sedimentisphaera salicampi]ARN56408.1 Arylsulfatase [Sedimentisphaera salicampi]
MRRRDFIKASFAASFAAASGSLIAAESRKKPNIVVIMVDDMGYSDIGCFGSEIETPNLDGLAKQGVRFTDFHNTARCCPSRASILSGLYPHQAGMGWMYKDHDLEGYQGHIHRNCVTIAEVLRPAGYFTAITGKWHVGRAIPSQIPTSRGFDRFFGCPTGAGFFYQPNKEVYLNDKLKYNSKSEMPEGFYTTHAWVDYGIQFAKEAFKQDKPFFYYLAHNAPHWPLQAPKETIEKYRKRYLCGWDELRRQRYERMKRMGILKEQWGLSHDKREDWDKLKNARYRWYKRGIPAWDELSEKEQKEQADMMAVYAAMIDEMDKSVGRLVDFLKEKGEYENTVFMFLSDNGGCAEGRAEAHNFGKNTGRLGGPESFIRCGRAWAHAQNTPFKLFKHYTHEGGIATPLIFSWPAKTKNKAGKINRTPGHIIDIMATCIDIADAEYPKKFHGNDIPPYEGKSLLPAALQDKPIERDAIFWEHEGNRAIRKGKWKLVSYVKEIRKFKTSAGWELYDMDKDKSEIHDLAQKYPEKVKELAELWEKWARRTKAKPWPWG